MWLAWHCHQQSQKKKLPPGHIPHRGIYYTSSCIVSKWSPQKDPESLPLEGHWQALLSLVMSDSLWPMNWGPPGSPVHGDSPSKNTGVSCCALLQGIFPTQGSNPGLFTIWATREDQMRLYKFFVNSKPSLFLIHWSPLSLIGCCTQSKYQNLPLNCFTGRDKKATQIEKIVSIREQTWRDSPGQKSTAALTKKCQVL